MFTEEEQRITTLGNLEKIHVELQGEHIQDQVAGGELSRKHQLTNQEFKVGKQGLETEKDLLRQHIEHLEKTVAQIKTNIGDEEKSGSTISKIVSTSEASNVRGMTEESKTVIKDNKTMEANIVTHLKSLESEKKSNKDVMDQHQKIFDQYTTTRQNLTKQITALLDQKHSISEDTDKTYEDWLVKMGNKDELSLKKTNSIQEIAHL